MMEFPPNAAAILAINFALSATIFALLWLINLRTRDPSFVDAWWPLGIVLMAWISVTRAAAPGAHAIALVALCTLWGLRLGAYLFWRWRKLGHDRRYQSLLAKAKAQWDWDFPVASLLLVFALQMPLQFIVALPVQLGQVGSAQPLGALGWLGFMIASLGFLCESIADVQLAKFKSDPANRGKLCDRGLWRYSRHPNHFGDACFWWGLYAIAAETGSGAWSLPGPLLLTFLLMRVSGAPTIEPHMRAANPAYADYIRRTSPFFPWPPRG